MIQIRGFCVWIMIREFLKGLFAIVIPVDSQEKTTILHRDVRSDRSSLVLYRHDMNCLIVVGSVETVRDRYCSI